MIERDSFCTSLFIALYEHPAQYTFKGNADVNLNELNYKVKHSSSQRLKRFIFLLFFRTVISKVVFLLISAISTGLIAVVIMILTTIQLLFSCCHQQMLTES